jgi:hypothetical protein
MTPRHSSIMQLADRRPGAAELEVKIVDPATGGDVWQVSAAACAAATTS